MIITMIRRDFMTLVLSPGSDVEAAKALVPQIVPPKYAQSGFTATVESIQEHTPGGFTDSHPGDFSPGEKGLLVGVKLVATWSNE